MTTSLCSIGEEANIVDTEMKTPEEEKSFSETLDSTSSSSYRDSANTNKSISDKENEFSVDPSGTSLFLSLSLHSNYPLISN